MAEDAERAKALRDEMVGKLLTDGMITTSAVERAFRTVPRHAFLPGVALDAAYNTDDAPTVKTNDDGVIISSVSAPFIQAQMLEQALLEPGQAVCEIGSGGYNAALLAEVVGPGGQVVTIDIDPDVTRRAGELLDANGYAERVRVVLGDAEQGVPDEGLFDRLLVTVGAWDIAPAWLTQLAPDGILVTALRMNGITRVIAFRRDGDHLASTSAEVCGFVPMQGVGEHHDRTFFLPDGRGHQIKIRFDVDPPDDPSVLDGVLAVDAGETWSGVTIAHRTSFADLHLWCAGYLPGFCRVTAEAGTDLAAQCGKAWFPFGVVRGAGLAYLAVRPAMDGAGIEFGAHAFGEAGEEAARAYVEQIQVWNRAGRHTTPTFAYWPTSSDLSRIPNGAAVLTKRHGLVTISWPTAG